MTLTTSYRQAAIPRDPQSMAYVSVAPGGRYFVTEDGAPFLVIGHNEAMPWPGMWQLHYEQDIAATEAYIRMLSEHGVTVVRIMLEYCQDRYWYFERPVGNFLPEAVLYWDDLIGLCERYKVRLLVTFYDTFFMSRRWPQHPYSKKRAGALDPASMLTDPRAFAYQQQRISFFIRRWGNSPAIFAYDLFNEIHPHWGGTPEDQFRWVTAMAQFVKNSEMELWGKRHLLTVSIFGAAPTDGYRELILRHPELDFTTTHVYEYGTVDNPKNTIDGALTMRNAARYAYDNMLGVRPWTDSESGPIHAFMDLQEELPAAVEDEYYHNMCWAHLASGGAGSGMRWPFRNPHTLTAGMHRVQRGMARFIPALDWALFSPRPIDELLRVVERHADGPASTAPAVLPFGCADSRQAMIWLLRDARDERAAARTPLDLLLPALSDCGEYLVEFWETFGGQKMGSTRLTLGGDTARIELPPFDLDIALAIKPVS